MNINKILETSVITILVITMVSLIPSKIDFLKYRDSESNRVYTEEDIERLTGTKLTPRKEIDEHTTGVTMIVRTDQIYDIEYTQCYPSNLATSQNNYQRLEYMLFDSPATASKVFERKRSIYKKEEDTKGIYDYIFGKDTDDEEPVNFISGWETGVLDASIHSFYLLKDNMLVTADVAIGLYYRDKEHKERVEAQNEKSRREYEELMEWVLNEAEI